MLTIKTISIYILECVITIYDIFEIKSKKKSPTFGAIIIADMFDGLANNLLVIYLSFGCDFTTNHYHTGFCDSFTGDL